MDELLRKTRTSYDQIAAAYAEKNAAMVPAVLHSAVKFITYLPADALILDAGCGHGRETAWFAERGLYAVAFDLSAGMLQQAGKIVSVPRIQGDMLHLPFPVDTFDAIWCNAAFLHIPKLQTHDCLVEFKRALRQNGMLYLALQAGSGEVWESQSYGKLSPRFFARYSFEQGARMIETAGFHILDRSEHRQGPRAHWLHYIARLSDSPLTSI